MKTYLLSARGGCGQIIYDGKIYVRSKGKPESIAVPTNSEMREVIDIAIDKSLENYLKRMRRIGITLTPPEGEERDDEAAFAHEREGIL